MEYIPVNTPLLGERERRRVLECLESGWISSEGPQVAEFERAFSARVGRGHGIAVCNGSAALDAAVAALGLGPGDEVILPALCIISCAQAVVRAGATPVLADCDPDTWNLDPVRVMDMVGPRTRAVLAVHTYGLPVDLGTLAPLCRERGLLLLEDAAEAIGLDCAGRPCGSFGDASVFSFYANKHVTTGEGGMVVADDPNLAERCRSLRNLCFGRGRERFVHEELGWNLRMTSLQAALGLAQLEGLDQAVARKREMGRRYQDLLAGLPGVQLPLPATDWAENVYWVFGLVLAPDHPLDAAEAIARLHDKGVGCRPFFHPMHQQPVFVRRGLFTRDRHPVSEHLSRQGFYIPSGLGLEPDQQERVAAAVREVLG